MRVTWPLGLDSIAYGAVNAPKNIILIVLGFKTFVHGDIKITPIDRVIAKNM